jgi:hypothetical protein
MQIFFISLSIDFAGVTIFFKAQTGAEASETIFMAVGSMSLPSRRLVSCRDNIFGIKTLFSEAETIAFDLRPISPLRRKSMAKRRQSSQQQKQIILKEN